MKERNLQKQEEIKKIIINAARDIVSKEGIQGLTIRKITKSIEYSPAIIYHYFKNKDEIIDSLIGERFKLIQSAIGSAKKYPNEPEKEIKEMFINYIKATLASPDEYKAFILNDNPEIVEKTTVLEKGITKKSKLIGLLGSQIQKGIEQGRFASIDPELTAQIIWTSTFGLIIKIMAEKHITQDQIDRLIEHNFLVLFDGIMRRVGEE